MRWRFGLLCVVAATAVGLTPNAAGATPLLHSVSATFTGGPDTVTDACAHAQAHPGAADHASGGRAGDGPPEHHDHARLMTHS